MNSYRILSLLTAIIAVLISLVKQIIFPEFMSNNIYGSAIATITGLGISYFIARRILITAWSKNSNVQELIAVPNYSGRWIGWYYSTNSRKWSHTAHEIIQTPFDIKVTAWGPNNRSTSITATIGREADEGLIWTYTTVNRERTKDPGGNHRGVHIMLITNDKKKMDGFYINDRPRKFSSAEFGSSGHIHLKFYGKELKGNLAYDESIWPKVEEIQK